MVYQAYPIQMLYHYGTETGKIYQAEGSLDSYADVTFTFCISG